MSEALIDASPRKVLLTGGSGFIGTHTAVALVEAGHTPVIVDNLDNSSVVAVARVRELVGGDVEFHELDVRDEAAVEEVVRSSGVDAVIHFAGLKAVGESVADPVRYWDVNVAGTVALLNVMRRTGLRDLVFSSSSTVYGDPQQLPLTESSPIGAVNPYGHTKQVIEVLLADTAASDPTWRIAALRYFNPVGAHPSGRIGEDPTDIPNNLMPYVMQVAVGRRDELTVFGGDYATPDGTCIRDYIHVVDLAEGHLAALHGIAGVEGCRAINLGTGRGTSVLELVAAASDACGRPIPYTIGPRRPGDAVECWAEVSLAAELLGWTASRTIAEACADAWNWQSSNPDGYRS